MSTDSNDSPPLTWVMLRDSGSDPRADSDAPVMVAATGHGLYIIGPVWVTRSEYPLYGLSYVPIAASAAGLDSDGFVHPEALVTLEDATHYLTDHDTLRQMAQEHHNKTAGGTDAN